MAGFLSSNNGQLPSGGVNAAAYGLGYGEVGVGWLGKLLEGEKHP